MHEILTLNKIADVGLELFDKNNFAVKDEVSNPVGIVLRSYNMHDMELPENLLGVSRAGAGVNNIPIDECTKRGVVVFNTPGANANGVKELVLASLLIASRNIVDGVNWAQTLKDKDGVPALVEKGKAAFIGTEIAGKKIGVIGLGAIGSLVAGACDKLGMEVYGYDPYMSFWRVC